MTKTPRKTKRALPRKKRGGQIVPKTKRVKKAVRKTDPRKIIALLNPPMSDIARDVEEALREIGLKVGTFDTTLSYALKNIEKIQKELHELFTARIEEASENGFPVLELHDLITAVVTTNETAERGIKLLRSLLPKYGKATEEYAKLLSLGPP
jgi:hypothetical protein